MSNQIEIISRTSESVTLTADPLLFDDTDAAESGDLYNLELILRNSDFDCEFEDCTRTSSAVMTLSFLDMSPIQSIATNCLSHYSDFVNAFILPAVLNLITQ